MKKLALMLGLVLALTTTGRVMADENEELNTNGETADYSVGYGQKWLCEAAPLYSPGYYYWVSYNYAYSYNQAYGTCTFRHGACRWACRVVW